MISILALIMYIGYVFYMGSKSFKKLQQDGQCTSGKFIKDNKVGTYYIYQIDGVEYNNISDGGDPTCLGKKYIVIYNPKNPKISQMLFQREIQSAIDCSIIHQLRKEVKYWNMH